MTLRKVTDWNYTGACAQTGYIDKSIRLTLECGHEIQDKASRFEGKRKKIPARARCRECDHDEAASRA